MITPDPIPRDTSRLPSRYVSAATSRRTTAGKTFSVTITTACGVALGYGSACGRVPGPPVTDFSGTPVPADASAAATGAAAATGGAAQTNTGEIDPSDTRPASKRLRINSILQRREIRIPNTTPV